MVRSRNCLPAKLKKCNTCGRTAMRRSGSNCKKWSAEKKKQVFCGTMRVVRTGKQRIIKMGENNG